MKIGDVITTYLKPFEHPIPPVSIIFNFEESSGKQFSTLSFDVYIVTSFPIFQVH